MASWGHLAVGPLDSARAESPFTRSRQGEHGAPSPALSPPAPGSQTSSAALSAPAAVSEASAPPVRPRSPSVRLQPVANSQAAARAATIIPAAHNSPELPPRNIVVLLDGTGNEFGEKNSNVIKTLSCLAADESQLLYYSSGVGTVLPDHASTWGRVRQRFGKVTDMMMAWNHVDFLCNAYRYLMDFYRAGDKVYIIGFSRGAYTARCLAGMIQQVGLLPPGNYSQIQLAYQVYMKGAKKHLPGWVQALGKKGKANDAEIDSVGASGQKMGQDPANVYRQIFGISRAVRIEFVGVWDTVSSLGGVFLPPGNVKSVKFFRQALALDERRARFAPEYRYLTADELPSDLSTVKSKLSFARALWRKLLPGADVTPQERQAAEEKLDEVLKERSAVVAMTDPVPIVRQGQVETRRRILQKNKEVWFMGCHSDVGGGNDGNGEDSLSNIPFRWMLREAVQCGIHLSPKGIALQPALSQTYFVQQRNLIPDELIELLEAEVRDEVYETEHEERIAVLIDKYLPPAKMMDVVELAAAADTGLRWTESGEEDGRQGETSDLPPDYGASPLSSGPVEGSNSAGSEGRRMHSREITVGRDGLRDPKESLTAWWYPLEVTMLQTRRYGGWTGKDKDVWRMNLGRPRQIIHGHMIHRSMLQRFQYHRPSAPHDDALPGQIQLGPRTVIGPSAGLPPAPDSEPIEIRISPSGSADNLTVPALQAPPSGSNAELRTAEMGSTSGGLDTGKKAESKSKDVYLTPKAILPEEWHTDWNELRGDDGGPTMVWEF